MGWNRKTCTELGKSLENLGSARDKTCVWQGVLKISIDFADPLEVKIILLV